MKVWIRGRWASGSPPRRRRCRPCGCGPGRRSIGPSTPREIASTASKSPGEVIGKPASITSTPSRASCWAISTFSAVLSEIPGDCSPSRRVVSKMWTRFASSRALPWSYLLLASNRMTFSLAALAPPSAIPPEGGGEGEARGCRADASFAVQLSARSPRNKLRAWSRAPADRRRTPWLALVAMGVSVVVIANDFSAINVAIPTMEKDFDTNVNTIQWVINAYALTFGVLIVTGGRLADMFGRRRAFFLGTAIFASMSALGGAAPTETWLIVTRVLMGVGGALMWPAILGMTYEILPEEKAGLAGGIIIGAAGLGNAVGPLIGGVFTDLLTWRWIFFANVPSRSSRCSSRTAWSTSRSPRPASRGSTTPGVAAISVGLVSLLIALDQVDEWGWGDPKMLAPAGAGRDPDRRLPADRAPGGPQRAGPARGDQQRELPRLLPGDPLHVRDVLRRAPVSAAVHADAARILAARGRGRDAALPR